MKKIIYFVAAFLCVVILTTSCTKQCQCKYYQERYKYEQQIKNIRNQYTQGIISGARMNALISEINKKIDELYENTKGHCKVLTSISTADGLQYYGCE